MEEDIVVTKFQLPCQVMQKRSTCSPYQREFILLYIDLVSGVSALLAWFPASWASKIGPCFIGRKVAPYNCRREVAIVFPHREVEGLQSDAVDQVLEAVKVQ